MNETAVGMGEGQVRGEGVMWRWGF